LGVVQSKPGRLTREATGLKIILALVALLSLASAQDASSYVGCYELSVRSKVRHSTVPRRIQLLSDLEERGEDRLARVLGRQAQWYEFRYSGWNAKKSGFTLFWNSGTAGTKVELRKVGQKFRGTAEEGVDGGGSAGIKFKVVATPIPCQ
jgi:hypothetical protein